MLCFWYKLVCRLNIGKLSSIAYWFIYKMHLSNTAWSQYIDFIKTNLENLGLSGIWMHQNDLQFSPNWFKNKVKRCL